MGNQHPKYPHLFAPLKVGNLTLKNRIFCAPTSLFYITEEGYLTPPTIAFFERKARGGAAVVTLGESIVHSETGQAMTRQVCLDDPGCLPGLALLANAIKRHGAVPNIELSHGGKFAGLASLNGADTKGRAAYGPDEEDLPEGHVKAYDEEKLMEVIESWGKGAAVAKKAGFQMVMLHAGHGWFFGQFLSPRTNHRTDRFGGSLENRARVLMMALDSVREAVGPGFPIEVRISGDELVEGGITIEESCELAKMLVGKCDILNVSCGLHETLELFIQGHPNMFLEHGCNVHFAADIKKAVPEMLVSTHGGIDDPQMMEDIISEGRADIIEMGRGILADQFFPEKAVSGREDEIVPCLRCSSCLAQSATNGSTMCVVNPVVGNEFNNDIVWGIPTTPKKVFVAGGGPGGLIAATTAAKRGHEVVLCEVSDKLGGSLNFAKYVDFKYDLYRFEQVLERNAEKAGVKILMNTKATPELVAEYAPDILLVATGAKPIIPRAIAGIEGENVRLASTVYGDEDNIGQKIVILGGGLVGCETAAHLVRMGKDVTLVEMRDEVAVDAPLFHKVAVKVELAKGTKIFTGMTGKAVTEKGLLCTDKDGKEVLFEADTVINSVGFHSNNPEADALRYAAPVVKYLGDSVRPGKVSDALTTGYYIALDI